MITRSGIPVEPIPGTDRYRVHQSTQEPCRSPTVPPGPSEPKYDSKWEASWAQRLAGDQRCGLLAGWRYHPGSFRLGSGKRYSPDFVSWDVDQRVTFWEVKGYHRNLRASLVALAWFARETPWARVVLVTREQGQWQEQEVGG